MEWNETELGRLAYPSCTTCHGSGNRADPDQESPTPCRCALRAMFRACYDRFRSCIERSRYRSRITYERSPQGRTFRGSWGRKDEEYLADFEIVARRTLDPARYRIFRFHYILGADANLCCRQLRMTRGAFFHTIYRIEEQLGERFATLEPYALFPPRDYFGKRLLEPVAASDPAKRRAPEPPRRGRPRTRTPVDMPMSA